VTFVFELAVSFLALGPPPARLVCFILLIFFQWIIFATGNYGFFNNLTMVLTVPLFDDRQFHSGGEYLAVAVATTGGTVTVLVSIIFTFFSS